MPPVRAGSAVCYQQQQHNRVIQSKNKTKQKQKSACLCMRTTPLKHSIPHPCTHPHCNCTHILHPTNHTHTHTHTRTHARTHTHTHTAVPRAACSRGRRRCRRARPRCCGARGWWWWCGSWRRTDPRGARPTAWTQEHWRRLLMLIARKP